MSLQPNRMILIDSLRGVSLLGILLINMAPLSGITFQAQNQNIFLTFLLNVFLKGKFYTLFSFLFGLGIGIQFKKRGHAFLQRRMIFLFLLGLSHSFLLWYGDILLMYSILAFLALPLFKIGQKKLQKLSLIFLVLPGIIYTLRWLLITPGPSSINTNQIMQVILHTFQGESYLNILQLNAKLVGLRYILSFESGQIFRVFGMILLGMSIGKEEFPKFIEKLGPNIKSLFLIALILNVFMAIAMLYSKSLKITGVGAIEKLLSVFALPLMTLSYIYFINISSFFKKFAIMGRYSLSLYISQTLFLVIFYYSIGGGFFGKLTQLESLPLGFILFGFQYFMAHTYSRYYKYGPLEWLWRKFSYTTIERSSYIPQY